MSIKTEPRLIVFDYIIVIIVFKITFFNFNNKYYEVVQPNKDI